MPTLEWIGKSKVVNHHMDVPYCTLERKYSFDEQGEHKEDNGSENMIIHGDNLIALKALLPQYEGRVKCIYIDPPYNTGNEGWIYNDNVNDPRILSWLGKVVGKEGEDLSRHDKWLCMMYPRLKLLQRMLTIDGSIFISIDSSEFGALKIVCDEIFGRDNFVDCISWFKKASPSNDAQFFSNDTEYIMVYAKSIKDFSLKKLSLNERQLKYYTNPDGDPRGPWNSSTYTCNKSKAERPNLYYPITNPNTGEVVYPKTTAVWKYDRAQTEEYEKAGMLFWGVDGTAKMPRFKKFLTDHEGVVNRTLWHYNDVNHTQGASNELKLLQIPGFATPKPSKLIERIIRIASDQDSIILDSFAGSGTTAHSLLNLNKADSGNRKFILIEMEDYAESITAERVKRVIKGYPHNEERVIFDVEITAKNLKNGADIYEEALAVAALEKQNYSSVSAPKINENGHLQVVAKLKSASNMPGTGGSFSYYELGEPILTDGEINRNVPLEDLRRFVFFSETRHAPAPVKEDEPHFLGKYMDVAYYLAYDRESPVVLDRDYLFTIKTRALSYVIYADTCLFSEAELEKYHITFKKIPRDIAGT